MEVIIYEMKILRVDTHPGEWIDDILVIPLLICHAIFVMLIILSGFKK